MPQAAEVLDQITHEVNRALARVLRRHGLIETTKLSDADVLEIRRRRAAGERLSQIATRYNISLPYASQVVSGARRKPQNRLHQADTEGNEPSAQPLTGANSLTSPTGQ